MSLLTKEARAAKVAARNTQATTEQVTKTVLPKAFNKDGSYTRHQAAAKASRYNTDPTARKLRTQQLAALDRLYRVRLIIKPWVENLEASGLAETHGSLVARYVVMHTSLLYTLADRSDLVVYDYVAAKQFNLWLSKVAYKLDDAKQASLALHTALATPQEELALYVYTAPTFIITSHQPNTARHTPCRF